MDGQTSASPSSPRLRLPYALRAAFTAADPAPPLSIRRASPLLFDHLVGAGEQRQWNREAECFRGLHVDDEFNPCGLLDRQVGRLLALKNPAGIDAYLAIHVAAIRSIAEEATSGRKLAIEITRRNRVVGGQRDHLIMPELKEVIWVDE